MKRFIMVLVVLALAAPTMADVDITCAADPLGVVTVSYNATTEPNLVRAFALDITVDSGAVIAPVDGVNTDYWVYPGSIDINTAVTPPVITPGSCVADGWYPGTNPGVGTSAVTIEMGSLYGPGAPAPATSGVLLTFTVDKDCTVTITENAIRGGVVMENPAEVPVVNLSTGCTVTLGCACKGDVSGDGLVSGLDLALIGAYLHPAYQFSTPIYTAPVTPAMMCADIDGNGSISGLDMALIVGYLHPAYQFSTPIYTAPCMP